MTANVTFVYAERKGVLRIPTAALRFRPPEELLSGGAKLREGSGSGKKHKHKMEKQAEAAPSASPSPSTPAAASAMKTVWAIDGEKLREVPVEIGVSDGTKVEVRKGELAEGDVLVTDAVAKAEASAKKKGLF